MGHSLDEVELEKAFTRFKELADSVGFWTEHIQARIKIHTAGVITSYSIHYTKLYEIRAPASR